MEYVKLIIFSAPSGSGKTTLVHHLLNCPELQLDFSISATSRAKRDHEIDGKDYYFLPLSTFKRKIKEKAFLEYEEVYEDIFYGTLKSEIERIWKLGKHVIFDIDVMGGLNIKKQFPEQTLAVFVKPPSIEELEKRLRNRKTETPEHLITRLQKASAELQTQNQFDVVIENNNLETAKKEAYKVVFDFINK